MCASESGPYPIHPMMFATVQCGERKCVCVLDRVRKRGNKGGVADKKVWQEVKDSNLTRARMYGIGAEMA